MTTTLPHRDKTLISYIPDFFEYCRSEKHASPKTIITYERFLNRFVIWLKENSLSNLSPADLSEAIIKSYKTYLSKQINKNTNKPLSNSTQNGYLIGLRVLLFYFLEKDIPSLHPSKVKLLRHKKRGFFTTAHALELRTIEEILRAPKTSTITGLRDRTLLETLFSTGLKVGQLVALNRDEIKIGPSSERLELKITNINKEGYSYTTVHVSESATHWLKRYLEARDDRDDDKARALFIRYKGPKNAPLRLTERSVENIVKKYVKMTHSSSLFTPESLRNIYILNLLQQEANIEIDQQIFTHASSIVDTYELNQGEKKIRIFQGSIPWHTVERAIKEEVEWLKDKISILPNSYQESHTLISCDECILRKIATLVVAGKIEAIELQATNNGYLWGELAAKENLNRFSNHGKHWHRKTMDKILNYFESQNYKVIAEPALSHGQADLGVYKKGTSPLFIEVGTVSLYKLWYNFWTMKNTKFLLIPSEKYAIEFKT